MITCSKCENYIKEIKRCREGKVNPKTKNDTLFIHSLFGNICSLNKWFSLLVKEEVNESTNV